MPKPKSEDYSSFEEYEEAVEIYNMMQEKHKQFESLQKLDLPPEEFEKRANELGFQKGKAEELFGEESPKMEKFMDLAGFSGFCNEKFFYGMLPEEKQFINIFNLKTPDDIPKEWLDEKSLAGNITDFVLDLFTAIVRDDGESILKIKFEDALEDKKFQEFGRSWYNFLVKLLEADSKKDEKADLKEDLKIMVKILGDNKFFKKGEYRDTFLGFLKDAID